MSTRKIQSKQFSSSEVKHGRKRSEEKEWAEAGQFFSEAELQLFAILSQYLLGAALGAELGPAAQLWMLNLSPHWGWHNWKRIRSQSSEWMWVLAFPLPPYQDIPFTVCTVPLWHWNKVCLLQQLWWQALQCPGGLGKEWDKGKTGVKTDLRHRKQLSKGIWSFFTMFSPRFFHSSLSKGVWICFLFCVQNWEQIFSLLPKMKLQNVHVHLTKSRNSVLVLKNLILKLLL